MNKLSKRIKNILNKDVTGFLNKYKIPLVGIMIVVLLACIGMVVTFAFYQVADTTPIVGGSVADISDLDIRVMAEERDSSGNGLGTYGIYPYIPKAGYKYNSTKSYCTNGSVIKFDEVYFGADITSLGHDVCYLYFDSTAQLDITLNVYAENVGVATGSNGLEGVGEYTKLDTTTLPSIGYEINTQLSSCENGSSVTYIVSENLFSVEAVGKDVCNVYMDAMDVDIALAVKVQTKKNVDNYMELNSVPSTAFYSLNTTKSSCTGTSTISLENQRVVVSATGRTNCVAFLDVSTGPILESMKVTGGASSSTVALTNSNLGSNPTTYYYSADGGETYTSSTNSTYTFNNLTNPENNLMAYSVDASGNTSRIISTSTYSYYGLVNYSNQIQTKTIAEPGYYKLETWGAQGGGDSTYLGGYGGYSVGYMYLDSNTNLYIAIGGAGSYCTGTSCTAAGGYNGGGSCLAYANSSSTCGGGGGATHIATTNAATLADLKDNIQNLVMVAGGGGGGNFCNQWNYASGGSGGGATGVASVDMDAPDWSGNGGPGATGGTQTSGSAFGKGQSAVGTENRVGGGGGYYGGLGGLINGAGGGSGYIGHFDLRNKIMYCYNCSTNTTDEAKTQTTTCHSANATENCAKEGNGFAIITYVGTTLE